LRSSRKALIALLPVIALILVLDHLDSHRLLGTRFILKVYVAGGIIAIFSAFVNGFVLDYSQAGFLNYTRYGAPIIEETLKASVLVFLFRTNRIGFLIDAGILGFTVGAGFSFVRGFGTAIMHGGATAIFAILAQTLTERHLKMNPLLYLPGLFAAIILHSIFNHFPVSPVLSTSVTLLILPTLLFMLFERNTISIHNYLEVDFNSHKRLLRQIEHGELSGCEAGRFLMDIKQVVTGSVARDMVYYFHLHTELVLSAEQLLLAREQGINVSIDKEIIEKLTEFHGRQSRHEGPAPAPAFLAQGAMGSPPAGRRVPPPPLTQL